jgi:hypothetical protein
MSLRNRARKLQRHTTLSYQQALAKQKALGARPAALARETGWPLDACDRYLVDGRAPIVVHEAVLPFAQPTTLDGTCEELWLAARVRLINASPGS